MLLKSLVLRKKRNNIFIQTLILQYIPHCKDFTFDGLKIVILKAKPPNKIFYEN